MLIFLSIINYQKIVIFQSLKNLQKNAFGEFSVAILVNELLACHGGPRVGYHAVGNQLVPALAYP